MTFGKRNQGLFWLELSAGLIGLISLGVFLALLTHPASAADQNTGFPPAARPLNAQGGSPFANPGGIGKTPPADFLEEDEDIDEESEDEDIDFQPSPPRNSGGGSFSAGGQPFSDGPTPTRGTHGISVSGGGNSNALPVVNNKSAIAAVDSFSGEGATDIVTDFNFPDADIMDIAKTMSKLTGKNFIFDKDVKGKISIISNSPITVGDAWRAFLTALDMNQFAIIPSGKYLRIARARDAREKQLRTYVGESSPDTDALITRLIPLKYINAEEVARTFHSFMPANARIIPYEQTNTIIVTDTGSNIAKLAKMLEILDVEGYDAGIEVIPVRYASASELSKLIDTLIPGVTGAPAVGGAPPPRFGGGGRGFNARRTREGGVINTIISDERTNTLIVHANQKGADQVRELVAKLDQKLPAPQGGGKVHVVYLQFADAEALATTLNNLSQAGNSPRPAVAPGAGGTGVNPIAATLFEGSIKISADKSTNSLVITASPADFVTMQRVINKLDIPRDEVYVEVVIMEVGVTRGFDWSANAVAPVIGGGATVPGMITNTDLLGLLTNPVSQKGLILPFGTPEKTSVTINGTTQSVPNILGLIKLIQENSNSNILATPQIIALDNTEATFSSAEKIPVPTSNVTATGISQQSITKEPVELSIKIKPQINKLSNFVKLDIETKLGDISNRNVPAALVNTAFSTIDRQAKTTVVVGDSDTVVIGGLMRDKVQENTSKVPILGDIPLLGWLFKSRTSSAEKTNLLIFMTPHIVRQYEKVRAILDRKLKERDEFLEATTGGADPLRKTRDDMIRGLPDLKDINQRRDNAVTLDGEEEPAAKLVTPDGGGSGAGSPAPVQPGQAPLLPVPQGGTPQAGGGAAGETGSPAPEAPAEGTPPPPTAPINPGGA